MLRTKLTFDTIHRAKPSRLPVIAMLLAVCFATPSMAQQADQKTFSSPEEAGKALVAAMQSNDEKAMLDILGRDGKQIVSSGDDAEDAQSRANFVEKYQEVHRLVKEPDGSTVLYIGAKNWPTPIPLLSKGNGWYFDTEAGKQEILYRRVGRNEMSAIKVCEELAAAQKELHPTQWKLIKGSSLNIRVGTSADAGMAKAMLNMLPKPKLKAPSSPFEEAQW